MNRCREIWFGSSIVTNAHPLISSSGLLLYLLHRRHQYSNVTTTTHLWINHRPTKILTWIGNSFWIRRCYHWMWRMGTREGSLFSPTHNKTSQITAQKHNLRIISTIWCRPQWPSSCWHGRTNKLCSSIMCSTWQWQITPLTKKCIPTSIQQSCVSPPIQKRTYPSRSPPITNEAGHRITTQGIDNPAWLGLRYQIFSNLPPIRKINCMEPQY